MDYIIFEDLFRPSTDEYKANNSISTYTSVEMPVDKVLDILSDILID